MMSLECGEELRRTLDGAFAVFDQPSPGRYAYIAAGADGKCPILDEHGWCRLHSQCGEAVQPAVCRLFPRSIKPGVITEAVCSGACERVIEMLMELSAPLRFPVVELETTTPPPSAGMDVHDRTRRKRCMELWQESGVPHPARLARIGEYLGVHEPADGAMLSTHAALLLRELGLRSDSLHTTAQRILEWDGIADAVRFAGSAARAAQRMPLLERHLENITANHMYYAQFPYIGEGIPPHTAWDGLYGLYAILYVIGVHAACTAGDADTAFVDGIAAALRCAEHTDFYHNAHIVLRGKLF